MLGYDDKRNFFRMMVNSPCQLQIIDDESSRTLQAVCKDISATGMSLEVDEPSIEVGTQVSVSIDSTSSQIPSDAILTPTLCLVCARARCGRPSCCACQPHGTLGQRSKQRRTLLDGSQEAVSAGRNGVGS